MKSAPHVVRMLAAVVAIVLSLAMIGHAQRRCPVPCGHRMHRFDVGPCRHPCYGPYGMYPCHAAGDTYPCSHPVHTFDYAPC